MEALLAPEIAVELFAFIPSSAGVRTHKIHGCKENSQEENDSQNHHAHFLVRKSLKHYFASWRNSSTVRWALAESIVATS